MKTLVLDGSDKNDNFSKTINETVFNILKDNFSSVANIVLYDHNIRGCIGDLGCFFKTPGKCIINDLAQEIPQQYIESDLVVFISPVTFGGFSSLFAKAFDRIIIQLESHNLMYSKGEIHRKRRYNITYPPLVMIGIENTKKMDQREAFQLLCERNAFHVFAPKHRVLFANRNDDDYSFTIQIQTAISELGEYHDKN